MGQVLAPFGVLGWIKVRPFTETQDALAHYAQWWLGKQGQFQAMALETAKSHGKELVAKLSGVEERNAALSLRGMQIAVPRSALPPPQHDEYYWTDLIGLTVTNTDNLVLGKVASLIATGANDVMVVEGDRQRLIPFIAQVVQSVDIAKGSLIVRWGEDY